MKKCVIKKVGQFPYDKSVLRDGKYRLEVNLFDDGGGSLSVKVGRDWVKYREDAFLEDWLEDAMEQLRLNAAIVNFLVKVKTDREK
jgi:hypothetical protein